MTVSIKKIEERFAESQDALVLQQSDLSLQSISDMVESKSIDISPKYQRRERWDAVKESGLIESFLLNIPVPPIYLAEDEYGTYSVIDGKQRVTAIHRFLSGELKLKELEKFPELEGFSFKDLPKSLMNALKIRPYLRVVTLLRQSDAELKHEVFIRLNKAGVPLNSQEIRNVAYRGEFNDLLIELSRNEYIKEQLDATPDSKMYREMIDVQFILRFFTVLGFYKDFPGNMDKAMDMFMVGNYKNKGKKLVEQRNSFLNSLEFCKAVWGKEGFRKPNGSKRVLQGFYDIQMVCPALLTNTERDKALKKKDAVKKGLINLLETDEEFAEAVSQFTSNSKNVLYRITKFSDLLKSL
ncbi:DUF262 domain-containing protein [Chitinophaga niabensis]|uniref:GmrSD restriction endonucleases N-terminal domain-containing protein n=1 Tax=Chitinophaga niabensis TaxID=536979 RepID=A0A1N6KCD3_9BACT|nr:DUF262 domain-containing protein [Chitinophaga niabensis]SIO53986.1 Protein of unknown function DUF262 [Chitinophaga niabensis]